MGEVYPGAFIDFLVGGTGAWAQMDRNGSCPSDGKSRLKGVF